MNKLFNFFGSLAIIFFIAFIALGSILTAFSLTNNQILNQIGLWIALGFGLSLTISLILNIAGFSDLTIENKLLLRSTQSVILFLALAFLIPALNLIFKFTPEIPRGVGHNIEEIRTIREIAFNFERIMTLALFLGTFGIGLLLNTIRRKFMK